MNGPCDASNDYVLFATGSKNLMREWARSNDSGRIACQPKSQEKLKYHVLKNPPATTSQLAANTVSSLNRLKTVQIGGRFYAIDPAIYDAVYESLQTYPVTTSRELQVRIEQIRVLLNVPAPIGVQLANVGLSNYTKRYTYLSAGSTFPRTNSKKVAIPNRLFGSELKTGTYAKDTIVYSVYYEDYRPMTETKQWENLEAKSVEYLPLFPGRTFTFNDSQFITVANNSGCSYTGDVTQIFPTGSASLFGVKVLSRNAIENFFKNGDETFESLPCKLTPNTNQAQGGVFLPKVGMLVNIQREGILIELLFVPAETELDKIQNINWAVDVGLSIQTI